MKHANFFIATILFVVSPVYLSWAEARDADNAVAASDKSPHPEELSDIQKYKIAKALVKAGKIKIAEEKLRPLAVKSFMLGDYAATDLASLMTLGGMKGDALKILDGIERSFPRTPLLLQVNKQRLRLACALPASDVCGERLKDIGDKNVAKNFRPFRKFYIAERKRVKGSVEAAYKLYQQIYYSHPAGLAGLKAGIHIEKMKIGSEVIDRAKLPHPSYFMRMKRVDGLMKAYRYEAAIHELNTILNIPYSKERKAKAYVLLGEARYKARDKKGSKEVLLLFLDKYKSHHKKTATEYRIAIIDWNLNNNNESSRRLKKLISSGASMEIKQLSGTVLGKIAESKKDFVSAKKYYEAALRLGPKPRQRHDLIWHLGWIEYQKGDYATSADIFAGATKKIALKYRDGKFLYWEAKSLKNIAELARADATGKELKRLFPNTFYGTRSLAHGDAPAAIASPGEMNSFYETVDGLADKLKFGKRAKYHHKRFLALISIEMYEQAAEELGALKKYGPKGGGAAMWMALQYRKARASSKSIRLLTDSAGSIKHGYNFKAPFWRVLYPVDYWKVALAQARERALDPFFIMAIIRQESGFDPKALSPANARGLMQLISLVGKKEFDSNCFAGYSDVEFTSDLLFDPELNISIGALHMADLKKKYNGNIVHMAAAYNAGVKRVDSWMKRFPSRSEDEFIELIPYPETRRYVKLVLKNLAMYRLIYGEANTPKANMEM